jgi:hypothetical protein
MGGVHATWHPHPDDERNHGRCDDTADDEHHRILTAISSCGESPSLHVGGRLSVRLCTRRAAGGNGALSESAYEKSAAKTRHAKEGPA